MNAQLNEMDWNDHFKRISRRSKVQFAGATTIVDDNPVTPPEQVTPTSKPTDKTNITVTSDGTIQVPSDQKFAWFWFPVPGYYPVNPDGSLKLTPTGTSVLTALKPSWETIAIIGGAVLLGGFIIFKVIGAASGPAMHAGRVAMLGPAGLL